MRGGEGGVKWLDAQRAGICGKAFRRHQRHGAETADVAVMQVASVVEREVQGRKGSLAVRERTAREQEGAREARLHDNAIARREVDHHKLRAAPAPLDDSACRARGELRAR